VSDAIMSAGGPTPRADMPKTVIRRRSRELLSKRAVRDAMVAGFTLDQLGVNPGDEIVVSTKSERNWMSMLQIATLITGAVLGVRASRGF
jgi:protein involved in polysaccharide export with SLBB domain